MDQSSFKYRTDRQKWGALQIAVIYLVIGILWILFSDKLAERLAPNQATLTIISIYKGWGFILVTAVMLFWWIQRHTAALSMGRQQLDTVMNALPVLISYVGSDRRYRFSNQMYEQWFGNRADGRQMEQVLGSNVYQKLKPHVDAALKGDTVAYETHLTFANGVSRFVSATYVPDKDAQGTVRGFFALVQDITRQKEEQEELRRWADAFEHCAHGIAIGDPSSNRIVLCNSAFAALYKARVDDIVGVSIIGLYAPSDHDLVRQQVTRSDQIGHAQFEVNMIRKDGSTFAVQMDLVSVHGDDGELLYRVATAQDISERKLVENDDAFKSNIIQHINDAVITSNKDLFITGWNSAAERMYGWRAEEVIGKKGENILKTEFSSGTRAQILQKLKETGEFSAEVTQLRRDGSRFPVETRSVAFRDANGEVSNFVSVNRDITERKQVEEQLERSHQKLNEILTSIQDDFYVLDRDWNFVYASKLFTSKIGKEPEDFVGNNIWQMFPKHVGTVLEENFRAAMENREVRRFEVSGKYTKAWYKMTAFPSAEGITVLGTDISERRQADEEVHRLNEKLEERVIERTAQLHAANKELESFSYSVSHDLRAPLRAISGYTSILVEDYAPLLDEEGKRICEVISNEARRMGELIDDLLSFSRLSRKEMQVARVDMKSLAFSVYGELTTEEQRNHIDFSVGKLPPALGDPVLFHQVWINLISNAIKFSSKKEGAVIEVGTKRSDDELIYCVRDSGAGFDIQYVDKLFGVFQRLHSDDEFEGTGVGLAIVQRIVQRHGGRVWAEGDVGKGATFYFALPRERENS